MFNLNFVKNKVFPETTKSIVNICTDSDYDFLSERIISKLEEEHHIRHTKPKIDDKYYCLAVHRMDFYTAVCDGDLERVKSIINDNPLIYISSGSEYAFRNACSNGHLEVAKWLLIVKPTINISAANENAFRYACNYGHLEVAKWLLSVKPTINISADNNDYTFLKVCKKDNLEVAIWLNSLYPKKYSIQILDNKIFSYKVN